jgi:sec-independent protein translocase protein TatC
VAEAGDRGMPLLEHLIELRNRLMVSVAAIFVAFIGCYIFAADIYDFLVRPLAEILNQQGGNRRLIYTALHEAFFTYIKVSFFAALFLSFPFVAAQFWKFVAPGLYRNERRALVPYLVLTPVLFFAGGALVYYFIFPLAWQFFISFETPGVPGSLPIQLEAKVNEYLSLVMRLIFAFGISFQLPLLLTLLAQAGLATSVGLAAKRKYALVIVFIAAAILTPPDVISQIGLAIPIIILYEASIVSVRMVEKKRARLEDDEDDVDDDMEETDFNET